jgi:SAM-dependent methyltransferase
MTDHRRSAPAAARNAVPITQVLRDVLPARGLVLEIASGSGEHALHFAREFPGLLFQPSDPEPAAVRSIEAWRAEAGLFNLLPALALDARAAEWPVAAADAILCINMIHISPWAAAEGLMRGAGRLLATGAPLYIYGPYRQANVETAPSNEAFDKSLRARDPEWELRDLEDVVAEAGRSGLRLETVTPMPANNLSVVFGGTDQWSTFWTGARVPPSIQANSSKAASAPASCAAMKSGTEEGAMPAKLSDRLRATVTAGLAKDVDAVNQ